MTGTAGNMPPSEELRRAADRIREHYPVSHPDWEFWQGVASWFCREAERLDSSLVKGDSAWSAFNDALRTARAYPRLAEEPEPPEQSGLHGGPHRMRFSPQALQRLRDHQWGRSGHRTEIPSAMQESFEVRLSWMDNDAARDSLRYLDSLDDPTIVAVARGNERFRDHISALIGPVNPWWITSQCATIAYERQLIDAETYDGMMK